ncbi:MAG: signal peptide peptidase SppA [Deltaproteobacteria bacterium]|nr:signal peptide peptidase SppA [Nannocystaceae bacterium]
MNSVISKLGVLAVLSSLFACREAPEPAPDGGGSPGGMPALSPLAGMFAAKLDEPGPYEAPRQSPDFTASAEHVAVLELTGSIGELESFSLLGGSTVQPLRELTGRIAAVGRDAQVSQVIVRVAELDIDRVHAEELRQSLLALKAAGKPLGCHTERVGDAAYHVLTACDYLALAPLGEIAITGPAATPVHLKKLLDRVGVTADFLHVGAFKGAAEPLTREAPSPEMLQTLEAIVEQYYASQLDAIEAGRKIPHDQVIALVDRGLFVGDQAVTAKLADEVSSWESYLDAARGTRPWMQLRPPSKLGDMMAMQRFIGMIPPERPSGAHVALVHATGNVVDGSGSGMVGAREEIASRTLVAALRAIAADDQVKAVVLRIDSGGGSALASEQIWQATQELAGRKPLVVSMGSVAASGGYYIAAAAREIFAGRDTLTGSIGVVGGKLVLRGALDNVGVATFDVHRGARAQIWSSTRTWNDDERQAVMALMQSTYDTFTERVADGRKLERAAVEAIAQGRVWTGAEAKQRGLVDTLGTLDDAIARACELGGVGAEVALEVYPPQPTLRDLLAGFGQVQATGLLSQWDGAQGGALTGGGQLLGPFLDERLRASLRRSLRTIAALQSARVWAVSPTTWWLGVP